MRVEWVLAGVALAALGGCAEPVSPNRAYWHVAIVDDGPSETGPARRRHAGGTSAETGKVSGDAPPSFSLATTCNTADPAINPGGCLSDEKAAKDRLAQRWKGFGVAERRKCTELTRSYRPSYVETITCLELDQKVVEADYAAAMKKAAAGTDVTGSIKHAEPSRSTPPRDKTP